MNGLAQLRQHVGLDKQAAKELDISKLLSISANIKAIHVKTHSYAKHMALDEAFEDLNESLDEFNECVQGYYRRKNGRRLKLRNNEISFKLPEDNKVFEAIEALEKEFRTAASEVTDSDSTLLSLKDNVIANFYQLYYRLDLN